MYLNALWDLSNGIQYLIFCWPLHYSYSLYNQDMEEVMLQ